MAASNLYPLTYKPGIKRDGTAFQPEYCTAGQYSVPVEVGNIQLLMNIGDGK